MDNSEDLKRKLLAWVEHHEKNGIKQHSEEWKKIRGYTIGGSSIATIQGKNPYSSIYTLITDRIGMTEFKADIKPQWGNLFEDVIKRCVEYQKKCIVYGEDLFIPGRPGISYSPDGLAVMNTGENHEIVLLEFKCPFMRIPSGRVPMYYKPQVKMGLDVLNLPTKGLFVEAVYRRCSWDQLSNTPDYDKTLVKISSGNLPIAYGIIGIYCEDSNLQILKYNEITSHKLLDPFMNQQSCSTFIQEYIEYYCEYGGSHNDFMTNDLGTAPRQLFEKLMAFVDNKTFKVYYGGIIFTDTDHDEQTRIGQIDKDLLEFETHCRNNSYINIGILPWKLFRIDYHWIEKKPNYIEPWVEEINRIIDIIKRCNDPANANIKLNLFNSFINNSSYGGFTDNI